jgi:uncharacterized protein (TIGR03435 family)
MGRFSILIVLFSLGNVQSQPSKQIEVASVRRSRGSAADSNLDSTPGGRLNATNITVRELIRFAYNVKDHQIERAPGWVEDELYDIALKSSAGKTRNLEEERSVVRELLEDRFGLTTHRETKQTVVHSLVVDRNGPKLTAHNDGTGTRTRKGCGHLAGSRVTVEVIATMLSRQLEREVLNRTNLPGKYDFQLDWTPDSGACPLADNQALPSIYTAIQQQLGLRLESVKGLEEFVVIDHVERPSEN